MNDKIEVSYPDQSGRTYYVAVKRSRHFQDKALVRHYAEGDTDQGPFFHPIMLDDIGTRERPGPFIEALFKLVEETEERDKTQYINIGPYASLNYRLRITDGGVTVQVEIEGDWSESINAGDTWNTKLTTMILNALRQQARHE